MAVQLTKPPTKVPAKIPRVTVYVPEELYERLEKVATQEERSLSQMALILIRQALDSRDRQPAQGDNRDEK